MPNGDLSHSGHTQYEVVAGRYELRERLAAGGMGEVFHAFDRSSAKSIALKRLRSGARKQPGPISDFMREYHELSTLRHPRIIDVYDFGVDREIPYYTMELLDGQDLNELSPLPYRETCAYLRDVASSLALLHARRLLHRDVSPRNVRRTSDGRCKLIDFGAMVAFGVPPNVTGTAPCVAPEALQGAALDQRADLYSLGAVAYRVLTGRYGYAAADLDELPESWRRPLDRPKSIVADIPDALDELVVSLLSLDPMKRPNSAAEVIDRLSAIGELPANDTASDARSFLTTSRLCGRDSTRKLFTRTMARAIERTSGAILIEGARGCGKTRSLEEAALIAQTCGLTPLRVIARGRQGPNQSLARDLVTTLRQMLPAEAERVRVDDIEWHGNANAAGGASARDGDASEQRARLQQTLIELFCSVAHARPLLLTVDDLDRADEFSAAFVSALAHQARALPLVIVASHTDGTRSHYPGSVSALSELATRVRLSDLARAESDELVESMFGQVPNLDRLSAFLYSVAHGNPKLTVALAEHLLERGVVRYMAGTWVLPNDQITESVPSDLAQMLALRLNTLSPSALALAELLSVLRGGATTESCLAASTAPLAEVFAALGELIRAGVLESAGHEYAFVQKELANIVRRGLSEERTRDLHRRWANVLLAQSATDLEVQLEAGWHLVHTEQELRGADLLARVAPELVDRGVAMATALPAIEAALAIYERHRRPLRECLRLRSSLVLSGYLFDYRLALRYGQETLELTYEASGLKLAKKLTRYVGVYLATPLATLLLVLRRVWPSHARNDPSPHSAMQYFVRTALGLLGVRATALDAKGALAVTEMVAPLAGSPLRAGKITYLTCNAISLQMQGHEAELHNTLQKAVRMLAHTRPLLMSESEHKALLVGLLTSDALNECYRENSQALQRADALERIGTCLAQTAAYRIRLIHALTRGEFERAEEYRRLIELHGIRGGTTWQVEWFAVPIEGTLAGNWGDLLLLRRSLERLRRMVPEMPSMQAHLDSNQLMYHLRHGEFAAAIELGQRFMDEHPPRSVAAWALNYAAYAQALIEVGQAERARALCESSLAHLSAEDLTYTIMYGPLEVAHATALAVLGERERADALLQARIQRLESFGDHAGLVLMHQARAHIARLLKDRAALSSALHSMKTAALASSTPALILLADRTSEQRARPLYSHTPPLAEDTLQTSPRSSSVADERAVTKFLQRSRSSTQRGRQALQMLARYMGSSEAYLFACEADKVTAVAALGDHMAAEHLTTRLRELVQREGASLEHAYKVLETELTNQADEHLRFHVILLAAERGNEGCAAVAAVRESSTSTAVLGGKMLRDLCVALSENVQSQKKPSNFEPTGS